MLYITSHAHVVSNSLVCLYFSKCVTNFTLWAQASDPATGQVVTYSEDVVHVRVLRLTGIKIFVPSTNLLAGVEVCNFTGFSVQCV